MIFSTVFEQIVFLFILIAIGYFLAKKKYIPENTEKALSKLENYIFIPALVMGTFINNFTIETVSTVGGLLLKSLIVELIVIPIAMLCVRFCAKDKYTQNIYLYGLCFSNFGFMGNAVVSALFPDIFMEYVIFTLVLWSIIYVWGVPVLLMGDGGTSKLTDKLKAFVNPMFIGMLVGMVIGICGIKVPQFVNNLIDSCSKCMSPIAMLLTGMTVARYRFKDIIGIKSVYAVTAIRLILFPLLFIAAAYVIPMSRTFAICAICSLAMPLGLNTIVIPSAYGKDTTTASSMAIVSHLLSCITIPVIFAMLSMII